MLRSLGLLALGLCLVFSAFPLPAQTTAVAPSTQSALGEIAGPLQAKSVDEIVQAAEKHKGFGTLQTAEFNRWGKRVFTLWYCPFSGRGDCVAQAYYFDFEKNEWTRFIGQIVPAGGDLSAEMPSANEIIFRSRPDTIALKESTAKAPRKPK